MNVLRTLALCFLLLASSARAETAVPPQLSLLVMLKILTYDQSFAGRGEGDFVVLVPNSPGQTEALNEAMAAVRAMAQTKIQARALKFVPVASDTLAKAVTEQKASALLILPGSTDAQVEQAHEVARANKLYTLALDPSYVQHRLALGVVNNAGRPQVVINTAVSRDLGINFPTSVLKIARTYQ